MAFEKEKVLASGETGNYWRVSTLIFQRSGMRLEIVLSLYKSAELAAAGAAPLPHSARFNLTITQLEIASSNLVAVAYTKMRTAIEELHEPISGSGDPASLYPDLVGCVDVL